MERRLTIHLDPNRGNDDTKELELCSKYLGRDEVVTQYGKVIRRNIRVDNHDRYYLILEPELVDENTGLLIYYHGSRDDAWMNALYTTRYIEYAIKANLIIVFGQAKGERELPHIDKYYGSVSHGNLYWEIRDNAPQFTNDLHYTEKILLDVSHNNNRVYFIGHSNGGVFACLVAIYLSEIFTAIVSHMGGIGYDPHFYLDFKDTKTKVPLLFYTGEHDIHKFPCQAARDIFITEDYPVVDILIERNIGHQYKYTCESFIMEWLCNFK